MKSNHAFEHEQSQPRLGALLVNLSNCKCDAGICVLCKVCGQQSRLMKCRVLKTVKAVTIRLHGPPM